MNTWLLVLLAVAVVLTSILVFRLHAFLTLLVAALSVALLTTDDQIGRYTAGEVKRGDMTSEAAEKLQAMAPVARLTSEFGVAAGKIGILIALASIIGQCLLESGAAATIVDRMLRVTGERFAPEAMAASSFVLGIPVFFDTVFYLMVPLARSLRQRVGKNYVLFLLAILAGGSIAHSLVPPTPGPLLVVEQLEGVELGTMMIAGLTIGSLSSVVALLAARLINAWVEVPLRFPEGESGAGADSESTEGDETVGDGAPKTPPLMDALLPILVPVLLITVGSIVDSLVDAELVAASGWTNGLLTLANKNVALGIGVVLAMRLLRFCAAERRGELVGRSLASAGNIILITAAGGAFGVMLRHAGIGASVGALVETVPGIMLLPVAFAVTAAIRTLQGSATVAMITAAGVLQGVATAESLPFHPVYLAMAIGAGSKPVSWMTDSAFWVMTRMSGMTEAEGLRVLSPMSVALGFSALTITMIAAALFPFT